MLTSEEHLLGQIATDAVTAERERMRLMLLLLNELVGFGTGQKTGAH